MKQIINFFTCALNIKKFGVIVLLLTSAPLLANKYKHVAVPPSDIQTQKLPSPKSKGVFSHSTMLPVYQSQTIQKSLTSNFQEIDQTIHLDASENSPLLFLSPDVEDWQITVSDPNGKLVMKEAIESGKRLNASQIAVGSQTFKGKKVDIGSAISGQWRVKLERKTTTRADAVAAAKTKSNKPLGYLLFKGDPNYKLYSYLDSNLTIQNSKLSLVAYLVDSRKNSQHRRAMTRKSPLHGSTLNATAQVTTPSGKLVSLKMRDDGLGGDEIAGDGRYSARVPTDETGVYTSQVQVEGVRPDGIHFSRTTTDLYPIERPGFKLSDNRARIDYQADGNAAISLPVEQTGERISVFVAAEVWGTGADGATRPASWIGGVVEPKSKATQTELALSIDPAWLSHKGLRAPYFLKSVRLQSAENHVPLVQIDSLPLTLTNQAALQIKSLATSEARLNPKPGSEKITRQMLMGRKPLRTDNAISIASANDKLLLVHGYCSGKVWNSSDFTNAAEFQDYKQNRSHDEFARRIIDFGAAYGSYGIIAHSQGGAAALHLYSRYWSGLDYASGGRLIQSLGSPYQGTALAGNAAVLGQLFGVGCGSNTDLTYSGAANWLSTIPNWARAEVDYYTTSFKTRWWAYDYCHLATDLLLDDPEDGTTEKWSGQLSGAVNMGHKKGWCHTGGMRDPAQTTDSSRNASMNSRAAR